MHTCPVIALVRTCTQHSSKPGLRHQPHIVKSTHSLVTEHLLLVCAAGPKLDGCPVSASQMFPVGSGYTFTPCGATGSTGPSQQQCVANGPSWLSNNNCGYTVNQGAQYLFTPQAGARPETLHSNFRPDMHPSTIVRLKTKHLQLSLNCTPEAGAHCKNKDLIS